MDTISVVVHGDIITPHITELTNCKPVIVLDMDAGRQRVSFYFRDMQALAKFNAELSQEINNTEGK